MHFSPASHQKALKNKNTVLLFFQHFPDLYEMRQNQLKTFWLRLQPFSFPVVYGTQDHIFFM